MPDLLLTAQLVAAGSRDEDRALVLRAGDATVLAVADGAGGTSNGREAAEAALREVSRGARKLVSSAACEALIEKIDAALVPTGGQCALVLAIVRGDRIIGAGAGDCSAWLISGRAVQEISAAQVRKPLLGSGGAITVGFEAPLGKATLLLGSDGLCKYASRDLIAQLASGPDLQRAVRDLAELPRLRSGELPDDVAVILCRK